MNAIVTIFLHELENDPKVFATLKTLSSDLKQIGEAYVFFPTPGRLFDFLSVLKNRKIAYGTHFDSKSNFAGAKQPVLKQQ